ncbi:hypothetical protein H671_3g8625 [Cricetulus griseus]|uniref:Uncharacterized protein n=1 Tax=Cricetulus griseus TaxID=10029 RepID=A0A061IF51_CRIGR|nr:hypothetical protein H671_3g8625 [Cricetulus griseus]
MRLNARSLDSGEDRESCEPLRSGASITENQFYSSTDKRNISSNIQKDIRHHTSPQQDAVKFVFEKYNPFQNLDGSGKEMGELVYPRDSMLFEGRNHVHYIL